MTLQLRKITVRRRGGTERAHASEITRHIRQAIRSSQAQITLAWMGNAEYCRRRRKSCVQSSFTSSGRSCGRSGGGEVGPRVSSCGPRGKQRLGNLHINWLTALSRNHTLCQKRAKPAPTLKAFGNRSSSAHRIGRFHHPSNPLLIHILHLAASSTCPHPLHRHPRPAKPHDIGTRNATPTHLELGQLGSKHFISLATRTSLLHIPRSPPNESGPSCLAKVRASFPITLG